MNRAQQAVEAKTSGWLASSVLCVGLVLVWVGQRAMTEGLVVAYGGAALVLAALLLRSKALASARYTEVRAVEGRLLAAYLCVAAALGFYALSTDAGLDVLGIADDARARVSGVLTAAWLATLVVALGAVLFIEIVYQGMPIAASVELRRVSSSLHAGLSLSLSLVFLVAINYVVTERDVRKDVSYFRTAEPSEGTLAMVSKLDTPLRATLFFRPGSDVLAQVEPYFRALAATKKLSFEVEDIALAPALAEKHKVRDNGHVLLRTGEGESEKGEAFKIGSELTEARRVLRTLDGTFQQSFSKLARPSRLLALTVGHGERNAKASDLQSADGTSMLEDLLKRLNLKHKSLGVAQGLGSAVPEGTSAVAIVGPSEPFLPEETAALIAYVRKGGRLVLMLDPNVDAGLSPLLEALGLQLLPGTVASEKNHMVGRHNASDRAIVYSNTYTSHASVTTVTRNQREVASVFFQGVGLAKADEPAAPAPAPEQDAAAKPRVTFPLRSAAGFWRDLNGNFERDGSEQPETVQLMAAVTLPNPGGEEGRAVVIGDGDFMTNKLAPNAGNHLLFVDSLAWLIGNEDLSGQVSSEEDIPIEHSRAQDQLWFYTTTFAAPAPIVLLGLWVSRRRRRLGEARS